MAEWSEAEILRVEGILDVNTLELLDFEGASQACQGPKGMWPMPSLHKM